MNGKPNLIKICFNVAIFFTYWLTVCLIKSCLVHEARSLQPLVLKAICIKSKQMENGHIEVTLLVSFLHYQNRVLSNFCFAPIFELCRFPEVSTESAEKTVLPRHLQLYMCWFMLAGSLQKVYAWND